MLLNFFFAAVAALDTYPVCLIAFSLPVTVSSTSIFFLHEPRVIALRTVIIVTSSSVAIVSRYRGGVVARACIVRICLLWGTLIRGVLETHKGKYKV